MMPVEKEKRDAMPFIVTTRQEMQERGWSELDVIFVSGDAYVDHPSFGVPLLARWLEAHRFRVGIIAQPDWRQREAFMVLGRPRLCFAVSAGAMDSMVAHYTPARKLRHDDAYTPGNRHGARPNRATIVYSSRLREAYRDVPVVIGGIEASLRRFGHYDYWEDKVRRSLLFDSKADLLIYGMGEKALLETALRLREGKGLEGIRGTCRIAPGGETGADAEAEGRLLLPSFEDVAADRVRFAETHRLISRELNPFLARTVLQPHGGRLLVCNPPALPLSEQEMDLLYALPFEKAPHPAYREPIPAWEQIRNSITSHRGCFGGCAFCAIAMHQGKTIQSRSRESVLAELDALAARPWFRGSVSDIGGPTANMYGLSCGDPTARDACRRESCLWPQTCGNLVTTDRRSTALLAAARTRKGIRHVAVSSGIRYDLLERQPGYFAELVEHHVSGLLKVAPEHLAEHVVQLMRKPGRRSFETFLKRFRESSSRFGRRQAIVPYLISGHPGCTLQDMLDLAQTLRRLGLKVEQVQDFTPTPGTLSTCMYHTGIDPETGRRLHVAKSDREKGLQKALLLWHQPAERRRFLEALAELGRAELAAVFLGGEGAAKERRGTAGRSGASPGVSASPVAGARSSRPHSGKTRVNASNGGSRGHGGRPGGGHKKTR